jgi:hypothetical protein
LGRCEFPRGNSQTRHPLLEILGVETVLQGLDSYGRVKHGSLTVKGWIKTFPDTGRLRNGFFPEAGLGMWHVIVDHLEDLAETLMVLLVYRDFQPRTTAPFFRLEGLALRRISGANCYQRFGHVDAQEHRVNLGQAQYDLASVHQTAWSPSADQLLSSMEGFKAALPLRQWKQEVIRVV